LHQYDDVFAGADNVFIFSPPHDGKETQLSAEEIASRVSEHGTPAVAVDTPEAMLDILDKQLEVNDAVLLSSSGAMGGLIESIPRLAEQKFPK
jgi:UDP-N-acetylmuramate-alanine ligase